MYIVQEEGRWVGGKIFQSGLRNSMIGWVFFVRGAGRGREGFSFFGVTNGPVQRNVNFCASVLNNKELGRYDEV